MVADFFNRVAAYPVMTSAYQQATGYVAWAKDRSAYVRSAADLAQSGLRRVASGAQPLLNRYEERITGLDKLACRQLLDRLETACPVVLRPTDEVMESGRDYYSAAVKPKVDFVLSPVNAAVAKAEAAKSAGLERYRQLVASRQGQAGLRRFDHLIELLNGCVDKCLPPTAEEEKAEKKTEKSTEEEPAEEKNADEKEAKKTEEGKEETGAGPLRSFTLAVDLGRKVRDRVAHRVAGQAADLSTAGHRLVDRLVGRSAPATAATAASSDSSGQPANQSEPPSAADDDDHDEDGESLDRTDMSTD